MKRILVTGGAGFLATQVIALTGSASNLTRCPLPADDPKQRRPDISIASALLSGWIPHVPLQTGLIRTIDYFKRLVTSCVDEETRSEARS